MNKIKIIKATVFMLVLAVIAGKAIGQPGGRGGQGWGGGPGWGRGMTGRPQKNADNDPAQPDDSWKPGSYRLFGQGPNQNIQPRQGRGPGGVGRNFQGPQGPYCPLGQGPNQNIRGRQGRGPGRFYLGRQGRGPRGLGQSVQGRGGRGFKRQYMMTQRGPMVDRGGRGPAMQARGGRGFQRRNIAPQGRAMNGRQGQFGPGGIGRPGRGIQPRRFAPEDWGQTNQPMPSRGRGWAPGSGQGWRQGRRPNTQSETAPDANAPKPPIVEYQPEIPQVE